MSWIISAGCSRRSADFAKILSLCTLIAPMIGAAFIKFGRAPTTATIFISRPLSHDISTRRRTFRLHDRDDLLDNSAQGGAIAILGFGGPISSDQEDLRLHIVNTVEEYDPTLHAETMIHRTDLAAKDTIDGDAQSRSLPVHRAAPADNQVRVPDQI